MRVPIASKAKTMIAKGWPMQVNSQFQAMNFKSN